MRDELFHFFLGYQSALHMPFLYKLPNHFKVYIIACVNFAVLSKKNMTDNLFYLYKPLYCALTVY